MTVSPLKRIGIGACIAAAAVIQLRSFVFDGDCAVFGLMALHISQLREFPLYIWSAHYAGTLVSYLAAVLFSVFGVSKAAAALPGICIAWIWILSQYALARRVLSPAGVFAALLLCLFPPLNVLHFTTWSGGVYAETFAVSGLLFLFAAHRMAVRPKRARSYYFIAGTAAGFGQWLSPGMLPAASAALIVFAFAEKEAFWKNCLPFFAAGFVVGYAPAIAYSIEYPNAALYRMGGRLLDLDRSFLAEPHKAAVIAGRIAAKIMAGPENLLKLPLYYLKAAGPVNLIFFIGAAVLVFKETALRIKGKIFPGQGDIVPVYVALFAIFYAFVLSAPAAFRYALPLYIAAPLFLGRAFEVVYSRRKKLAVALLTALVCANLFPVFNALGQKPLQDSDALAAYLERIGVKYAFSDYNTAYLVTFLTKEKVILSPTLLHKDFFDRYPEYTRQVRNSPRPVFIISSVTSPGLEELAAAKLKELGIAFKRESFAGYTVLSPLSRRAYPEELGLQDWK